MFVPQVTVHSENRTVPAFWFANALQ